MTTPSGPYGLRPGQSVWLDLCRVLAAGAVFVGHARALEVAAPGIAAGWHRAADDAVVLFFVLSGFVIAWSAQRGDGRWRSYLIDRLSRVWSAAVPLVLVVLALDLLGMRLAPDLPLYFPDWQYPKLWLYLPVHWAFLGGTWVGPMHPFSMAPYWSLAHEVWYYLLFGAVALLRGRVRLGVALACLAIMGPRLWLLLPVWWSGTWLWRWQARGGGAALSPRAARTLMAVAVALYALILLGGARDAADAASRSVYAAIGTWTGIPFDKGATAHFLADWLVALPCLLLLAGAAHARLPFGPRTGAGIRRLAAGTFTFYLLHFSLMVFARAAGWQHPGWPGFLGFVALTLALTWVGVQVGEGRRGAWRRALERLLPGRGA